MYSLIADNQEHQSAIYYLADAKAEAKRIVRYHEAERVDIRHEDGTRVWCVMRTPRGKVHAFTPRDEEDSGPDVFFEPKRATPQSNAGRPRIYPEGGRVKTTTEFSQDLDAAINALRGRKSKTAYLEEVLRQVPEIVAELERQQQAKQIDAMIAKDGAIIL